MGVMTTVEELIGELVDRLAAEPEAKINPPTWRRLLIYVPAWLIKERYAKNQEPLK